MKFLSLKVKNLNILILFKMEKVVIIGSNCFSGSHFISYLLENTNYEIIGISRSPEYNPVLLPYKGKENGRFKFYRMDLNKDLDLMMKLFQD